MSELTLRSLPSLHPVECGPSVLLTVQSVHKVKCGPSCPDPTRSLPDAGGALLPISPCPAPTNHGPNRAPDQGLLTLVLLEGLHQILQGQDLLLLKQ